MYQCIYGRERIGIKGQIWALWRHGMKAYRKTVKPFVKEQRWVILIVLGLIIFGVACYGFSETLNNDPSSNNPSWTFYDIAYNAFLLFQLKFPFRGDSISPALQFARFAAPFLTFCTFYLIFASWVLDRVKLFVLKFVGGHVVICGMGYIGPVLARNFYDRGYDVVVIEKDPNNRDLDQFKNLGAIVIVGDATKLDTMKRARAEKARFLFTVTGDDGVNSEIAINCHKLVEPGWLAVRLGAIKNGIRDWLYGCGIKPLRQAGFIVYQMAFEGIQRPLRCFVHVVDPNLSRLLRSKQCKTNGESIKMEFFNIYSRAGEVILSYPRPFIEKEGDTPTHILVAGMGRMGERLILQVAQDWRAKHYGDEKKIRITILDRHASAKRDSLLVRYPLIEQYCRFHPMDTELMSTEFLRGDYLFDAKGVCDLSRVYICLDDESLGLSVALQLNRIMIEHGVTAEKLRSIPIVVRTRYSGGLSILLNKMKEDRPWFDNVYAFPLVDITCNENIVLSDVSDILARAVQGKYIRYQQRIGRTPKEKPAMKDWDNLGEDFKNSCLDQAHHVWQRLSDIDCEVVLYVGKDKPFKYTKEEIEYLAEKEHERFVTERRKAGWKDGPYDDKAKTSPYLGAYKDLEDNIKDYDRDFIRNLPGILSSIDLRIVRKEKVSEKSIERLAAAMQVSRMP